MYCEKPDATWMITSSWASPSR